MNHDFTPFLTFWHTHESAFISDLYTDLISVLPHYARLPHEQLVASIERKNELWQQLLLTGDSTPILERTHALVQQRTDDHFPLIEMVKTGDLYRDHLWRILDRFYSCTPLPLELREQIEQWTRIDRDVILNVYTEMLQHTRIALSERVEMLEQQRILIHDLSMPIIPLAKHIVAMPLIGSLDTQRANQIMDTLLLGVEAHQAKTVLLDITGVPVVDTYVANALIKATLAVRLLGAEVVLTGIRPEVAQTLVSLGVSLTGITSRATLQEGIAYALRGK